LLSLTEDQLEKLKSRHESYVAQRETFGKIPSIFSILGISKDEIYCRTLKGRVSRYYFCGECENANCHVKKEEIRSRS